MANDTTMRLMFAMVLCHANWTCELVDIEAAFLNADLEDTICMEWPEGSLELGIVNERTLEKEVVLPKKAMCGAVQASRLWFKTCCKKMRSKGHIQSKLDPCLWFRVNKGRVVLMLVVYVDDIALGGEQWAINEFKQAMTEWFNISDLGELQKHSGIKRKWGEDENGEVLQADMRDFAKEIVSDCKKHAGKDASLQQLQVIQAHPC